VFLDLILLAVLAAVIYWRSRASTVNHQNVNAEWAGTVTPAEPEPARAA
jgi:inorganic phosphate transporter, PiT family